MRYGYSYDALGLKKSMFRTYHEESSSCGNNGIFPWDIFNSNSRKTDRDDSPEAENFFDKSGNVWYFFFQETFLPCISVRVDFNYLVVCAFLDLLAV